MKRSFMLCVSFLLAVFVSGSFASQKVFAAGMTSPDGLELSGFRASTKSSAPKVGDTVKVSFKLKNVSAAPIQFHPNFGVFVGTRWNSTTDANNRDFGHKMKGRLLNPGKSLSLTATRKLDAAGTWRFWPAYNVNGHWGPFRWNEAVIEVREEAGAALQEEGGIVSPDGLKLTNFRFLRKPSAPKVGDAVMVAFKLTNVSAAPIQFNPNFGVFVGARWNSTTDANNRDFGHKMKGMVLKPNKSLSFTASRKLDAAGTWRFWPAYNVNGHWGPFRWNEAVMEVGEAGMPRPPMKKPVTNGQK